MKEKFTESISQLSRELRLAQEESRRYRDEIDLAEQRVNDVKRNMGYMQHELNAKVSCYPDDCYCG